MEDFSEELNDQETYYSLLTWFRAGHIDLIKQVVSKLTPKQREKAHTHFDALLWYDMQDEAGANNSEEDYKTFLLLFKVKFHARCCKCNTGMNAGFYAGNLNLYYCSEPCLHRDFTPEEWQKLCDDANDPEEWGQADDCYYTEWDEEDEDNKE